MNAQLLPRVRHFASQRWPWVLLLLAQALAYYGSYVRHGLGFRDEGQTVAFLAQRLLEGETPLKDVVLSYNVLWFYPVVWLYQVFGVSYVLLRGYCFVLSTLTAVVAFFLVEKTTRRPWLAWLVATVLVLIPGSTFKNYIPLLAVANTWCLVAAALAPPRSFWWDGRTFVGALALGITFLVRIDIGVLFAALWIGFLLARTWVPGAPWRQRFASTLVLLAVLGCTVLALQMPFYWDAQRRGFAREFAYQYFEKAEMVAKPVRQLFGRRPASVRPPAIANPAPAAAAPGNRKALARAEVQDFDKEGQNRGADFLFLMYAPIVGACALAGGGALAFFRCGLRREPERQARGLAALVAIGGALTTFPQFFFFRPDIPHLSEFMPGYLASAVAALGLLWQPEKRWRQPAALAAALLLVHVAGYVALVLPDRWAGTWAARNKRTKFFTAENGVKVFVSSRELNGLTAIQKLLRQHAPAPTDYVVCYPYSPGINLLADRPTYERNVYVDNAMRSTRWDDETIAKFERHRPAVIVLSDWDINGTDGSRFSVWAVKTKTWIQTHYVFQGSYLAGSDAFEIYTRPPASPQR